MDIFLYYKFIKFLIVNLNVLKSQTYFFNWKNDWLIYETWIN